MPIKPWTVTASKQLLKDKWVDVKADSCVTQDGKVFDPFYVYSFPDYATAVAITEDGKVILERMYRHGLQAITTELPGGCVDTTDTSLEAAMERELLEETGYRFKEIQYLGKTSPNPTTNTNVMHMFLATGGVFDSKVQLDEHEEVEVFTVAFDEFLQMVQNNQFIQSMQMTTIFFALKQMGRLQIL
jgi:ADP-ribose pyrophosphatase